MADQYIPDRDGQDEPISYDPDGNPIFPPPNNDGTTGATGGTGGVGDSPNSGNPTTGIDDDPPTRPPPIDDPIDDPETPDDPVEPPEIPTGQYLRTRYDSLDFSGSPKTSLGGKFPAYAIVPSVNLRAFGEQRVSYRWRGYFNLEGGIYTFQLRGNGGYRVTVGSTVIFSKTLPVSTAPEVITINKELPSGRQLVSIEWSFYNGGGQTDVAQIYFDFTKISENSWVNCLTGERTDGAPPEGWGLSRAGCWKPPADDDGELPDVVQVIQILPDPAQGIDRTYISNSGQALQIHRLLFFNRSTNMTVAVDLAGPQMTWFSLKDSSSEISGFSLQPQEQKFIDVRFKTAVLDTLDEGLNASGIYVNLSVTNVTVDPDNPTQPPVTPPYVEFPDGGGATGDPQLPNNDYPPPTSDPPPPPPPTSDPPPPPPPDDPVSTWCDGSVTPSVTRYGSPPSDWLLRSDGCYIPPIIVDPPPEEKVIEVSATAVELTPTVSADGTIYSKARLNTVIVGEDPANFSYEWDFDSVGVGVGIGNTTAQSPTVSWKMTDRDLLYLRGKGLTGRLVKVTARLNGTNRVFYATRNVSLKKAATITTSTSDPEPPVSDIEDPPLTNPRLLPDKNADDTPVFNITKTTEIIE